jgi:hypothetical protein
MEIGAETHYPTPCMLLTTNTGVPEFGIRCVAARLFPFLHTHASCTLKANQQNEVTAATSNRASKHPKVGSALMLPPAPGCRLSGTIGGPLVSRRRRGGIDAKPKRQAATPRPAKPNPKPVVLTPEDIEFGIKTGMLKP